MDTKSYLRKRPVGQKLIFYGGVVIFLVIISSVTSCVKVDTSFYDKVLSDFGSNSYFVALNIKSPSYKGRAIIENNDLYNCMHQTRGLSKEKYQSRIKRILIHNRALRISEKAFLTWNFKKVDIPESMIKIADRGRDNFVAYYFNGIVLNYGIKEAERNAIINQLFCWDLPAKFDKISGDLILG